MSFLLALFFPAHRSKGRALLSSNVDGYSLTMTKSSCRFCGVAAEKEFNVVWEDDTFIAFRDHKPAATHHIQLVPKFHIHGVQSLGKSDVALVKSMADIGKAILDGFGVPPSSQVLGYHIPPFNSVNHLHLHVQALPYVSKARTAKYRISRGWGPFVKGFGWFVEVQQLIQLLEEERRVWVWPS